MVGTLGGKQREREEAPGSSRPRNGAHASAAPPQGGRKVRDEETDKKGDREGGAKTGGGSWPSVGGRADSLDDGGKHVCVGWRRGGAGETDKPRRFDPGLTLRTHWRPCCTPGSSNA